MMVPSIVVPWQPGRYQVQSYWLIPLISFSKAQEIKLDLGQIKEKTATIIGNVVVIDVHVEDRACAFERGCDVVGCLERDLVFVLVMLSGQ